MNLSISQKISLEIAFLSIGAFLLWLFPFHRLYFDVLELEKQSFSISNALEAFKWREVLYPELLVHFGLIAFHAVRIILFQPSKILGSQKILGYLKGYDTKVKLTVLKYAVKFFFIPIMLFQAVYYSEYVLEIINSLPNSKTLDTVDWIANVLYTLIWNLALCITLWIYLFGYMVESKNLKSEIISVDSTFLGWFSTLICYNIFFTFLSYFYPLMGTKDAYFASETINLAMRILIMTLIILRVWTVFNLGSKCSNLTYRGVVSNGMYAIIRHPHYFLKLITWWILFIPFYYEYPEGAYLLGMIVWTSVYIIRLITEERHLSQYEEYRAYQQKVKYRLIPFIW